MDFKLLMLFFMFFMIFVVFTGDMVTNGKFITLTKASYEAVSYVKSFTSVYPMMLPTKDGKTSLTIKVFVRGATTGNLISGRVVALQADGGSITPKQLLTDKTGVALFKFSCDKPGLAEITTLIDNKELPKKTSIKCNKN